MRKTLTTIAIAAGIVGATFAVAPIAVAATNVHEAPLAGAAGFTAVKGKAKFSIDDGVRRLEAQIENALSLKGAALLVRIDSTLVGRMTVSNLGAARLRVSGSSVPSVRTGSAITVRRASNGGLVASGKFN